jgi:hypothetical protein
MFEILKKGEDVARVSSTVVETSQGVVDGV